MRWLAAVGRASIWHRDAPAMRRVQKRFRPVFRIGLPVIDGILIAFSVAGILIGSNAVKEFATAWFSTLLAAGIGAAAAVALFGLVFNRPRLELTAKFVLAACLAIYEVFLIASATVRSGSAALTAALVAVVIVILALRVFDLIEQTAIEDGDA